MGSLDYATTANQSVSADVLSAWDAAAQYDSTITLPLRYHRDIAAKRVTPTRYSRALLFDNMTRCRSSLFTDFPVQRFHGRFGAAGVEHLVEYLRCGFPRRRRARVRGRTKIDYLSIPRVVDKWLGGKSVFGVTDLHYIATRFDTLVDTHQLNGFNILPRGTDGFQSQDSLVISATGAVTDSHSDDHSGSNHCFTGTKLWLLWDTIEGLENGVEDVERCTVLDRAAFDIGAFATMKSSSWILIEPGQTMFIPAHLSHKVITLDRYIGLGSFHAGLPGLIDLLIRWHALPPLWAAHPGSDRRRSVAYIAERAIRKVATLRKADRAEQYSWGVPYLLKRLQQHEKDKQAVPRLARQHAQNAELQAFISAAMQLI